MRTMIAAAFAALLLSVSACDLETDPTGSEEDAAEENGQADEAADDLTTEGKLAMLFGGDEAAIGAALDHAARYCAGEDEDRDRVADYITFTIEELDEKKPGHEEDALTIAEAIAESAEAADGTMECSSVAATLLVLMLPGN